MTRTYYIRYSTIFGEKVDKIQYTSPEDRPRFHKVEALNKWKATHVGYGAMICKDHVFTPDEWKKWQETHKNVEA